MQSEKSELDAWLASSGAYNDANKTRLQEQLRRQGEIATRIANLEEDWLWVHAELESQQGVSVG